MRKIVAFVLMAMVALGVFCSGAMADILTARYSDNTLRIDFVGSRIPTWGCNDVEGVQWDRLVFDSNGRAQVEVEFYGINHAPVRLWVNRLPASQTITLQGGIGGIPCGARFQIRFLIWVGDHQEWKYWPISDSSATSEEPTPAEFHGIGVELNHVDGTFRTVCP